MSGSWMLAFGGQNRGATNSFERPALGNSRCY